MSSIVVECQHIAKTFNNNLVLKDINFSVKKNESFAIIGQNGMGKTVLLNILLGFIEPDDGKIKILNLDIKKNLQQIKQQINFVFSHQSLQEQASVYENLITFARLYNIPSPRERIFEYGCLLNIEGIIKNNKKFCYLSSGEKSKIYLCKALLTKPKILFLDEPTAHLDPIVRGQIINFLLQLKRQKGITIIFASHQIEEIRILSDRVLVLKNGSIAYIGKIKNKTQFLNLY